MGSKKGVKGGKTFFASRTPVEMVVVSVLGGMLENRGLRLIEPISRAVRLHEIHEWIITDEPVRDRKEPINRVAYFAFAEVMKGGIILLGDKVLLNGKKVGEIIGYDDTHMPNHQNIIISARERIDGVELGTRLGDIISIMSQDD